MKYKRKENLLILNPIILHIMYITNEIGRYKKFIPAVLLKQIPCIQSFVSSMDTKLWTTKKAFS